MSRIQIGALLALLVAVLVLAVSPLQAATCPPDRNNIQSSATAGETADQISTDLAGCLPSPIAGTTQTGPPFVQTISAPGGSSTNWEAIEACGYHPQRKEAACPIQIRQMTGYGGAICTAPGSTEFVLFCVDFGLGAGLEPINVNGFHLHDSTAPPTWDFAAVIQSNAKLLAQMSKGQSLKARAILSWMINPMVGAVPCNFVPVWGNRSDFRIRLDP
jgi:hypothetical protein